MVLILSKEKLLIFFSFEERSHPTAWLRPQTKTLIISPNVFERKINKTNIQFNLYTVIRFIVKLFDIHLVLMWARITTHI